MSAAFQLSEPAEIDLLEIWVYSAQDSVSAANRVVRKISERFPLLAQFPEIGQKRDDLRSGLRTFPVDNYLIFYERIADGIFIARILHGARNYSRFFRT